MFGRDLGHDQRDRRLPDYRSHAEDVPQEGSHQVGGEKVTDAQYFLEATYLIASILFVLGLKGLSHPDTARRGMVWGPGGIAAAVFGTLFHSDNHKHHWCVGGRVICACLGNPLPNGPI